MPEQSTQRRRPGPDLVFPLVLVTAGILFFFDALFSSKNFYFRDILNFHYPLRKVLVDSFARGEFPLWNPFIYLGQPMLANPNYMTFYPTNLLHVFLSFNYAFKLHFILHPILGGLGLYFLQRRLDLAPVAALAGALAYEFSGVALSFLNLYNIVPAVALMPWIGWAFLGAVEDFSARRLALFGLVLGLQIVALEPIMFQCGLWFVLGLAALHVWNGRHRGAALRRALLTLVLGALVAFGLSAAQSLPTLELLPLSARGEGFSYLESATWSASPLDLLNTLIPNFYGTYYTIGNVSSWGETMHAGREPYLVSYFIGTVAAVLAGLSLLSCRNRLRTVLLVLAGVSLFLGLGENNPVHRWLFDHISLFRIGRFPSKYLLLGTIAVAMLAGLGLEALTRSAGTGARSLRRSLMVACAGLVLAVSLGLAWFWMRHDPAAVEAWMRGREAPALAAFKDYPRIIAGLSRSVLASAAFAAIASCLVLALARRPAGTYSGAIFVFLLAAELIPPNLRLTPLISDTDVSYVPDINRYLAEKGPREPYRVLTTSLVRPYPDLRLRFPNRAQAWLVLFAKASGQPFFGIEHGIQYSLDRSVDFLNTLESDELTRRLLRLAEPDRVEVMKRLNTPVVISLGPVGHPGVRLLADFDTGSEMPASVFWLNGAVSRAIFASGVEKADSRADALERFLRPDFDFGHTVVLGDSGAVSRPAAPGSSAVRILSRGASRIVCESSSEGSGYVVLLDSYYPGWRAYVDGARATLYRADYAFRAVPVPAGVHQVEFRFVPVTFYGGLAVTLVTCLVLVGVLVRSRLRR